MRLAASRAHVQADAPDGRARTIDDLVDAFVWMRRKARSIGELISTDTASPRYYPALADIDEGYSVTNQLFFGDNLDVLRESIKDESVDLIYLDPPFNSNASYNVLFATPKGHQSAAQIEAFEDTWHWTEQAEREFAQILGQPNTDLAEVVAGRRIAM
jgi:hypothetical protein